MGSKRQAALEQVYEVAYEAWGSVLEDVTYASKTVRVPEQDVEPLLAVALGTADVLPPSVADQVASAIDELGGRAFFKLGSRSPKDAVLDIPHPRAEAAVAAALARGDSELAAYVGGCMRAMAVASEEDIVWMMAHSLRIRQDLRAALAAPDPLPVDLVLREWIDIEPWQEWRVFVAKGTVSAISQYFHFVEFPQLTQGPDYVATVESAVLDLWGSVIAPLASELPVDSYTADVVVRPDGSIWLTELNPFGPVAGPCCFSWKTDGDLLAGTDPSVTSYPVVRILTAPFPDARLRFISAAWEKWFAAHNASTATAANADADADAGAGGCTVA